MLPAPQRQQIQDAIGDSLRQQQLVRMTIDSQADAAMIDAAVAAIWPGESDSGTLPDGTIDAFGWMPGDAANEIRWRLQIATADQQACRSSEELCR
jgi:hypothetical protein